MAINRTLIATIPSEACIFRQISATCTIKEGYLHGRRATITLIPFVWQLQLSPMSDYESMARASPVLRTPLTHNRSSERGISSQPKDNAALRATKHCLY
jgi:hypothetical protein